MSPKVDDPLRTALRSLPARDASPQLTARVLARLEAGDLPSRPRLGWRWTAVAAATLVVLIGLAGASRWREERIETARRARLEELQRQSRELRRELGELQSLARDGGLPVIYLAGSEERDFVLDLARLASEPAAADRRAGRPVRFENPGPDTATRPIHPPEEPR